MATETVDLALGYHGINNIVQAHPGIRTELCNDDCKQNCVKCGHNNRFPAEEQHIDQEDERYGEMAVLLHYFPDFRELVFRRTRIPIFSARI